MPRCELFATPLNLTSSFNLTCSSFSSNILVSYPSSWILSVFGRFALWANLKTESFWWTEKEGKRIRFRRKWWIRKSRWWFRLFLIPDVYNWKQETPQQRIKNSIDWVGRKYHMMHMPRKKFALSTLAQYHVHHHCAWELT